MTNELKSLYQALQDCLDARDLFMKLSRQRLGDNPRDHDGKFTGIDEQYQDVAGIRPDADITGMKNPEKKFDPWTIYPKPPSPHWHWKGKKPEAPGSPTWNAESDFVFSNCKIPGPDQNVFDIDSAGVYQVYRTTKSK